MGESKTDSVRLELHAQQLKNAAGAFKGVSDPFAIVTLLSNNPKERPKVLGKTEVIKSTLSPRWTTNFDLEYGLGFTCRINVGVWDAVSTGTNKPMGSAVFEVGEVLGAKGNTKAKKLRQGGTLFVRITPAPPKSLGQLNLGLRGIKLVNTEGLFGRSDPFVEISARITSAGGMNWQTVYRSDHVDSNLDPEWKPFSVDLGRLCEGDVNRPIMIEIFDWEKNGKHRTMGKIESSVNSLIAARVSHGNGPAKSVDLSKAFSLMRRGKVSGKIVVTQADINGSQTPTVDTSSGFASAPLSHANTNQSHSDELTLSERPVHISPSMLPPPAPSAPTAFSVGSSAPSLPPPVAPPSSQRRPTFVDYLTGGLELELSIAIDFTGSNGDPRRFGTLHYRHPDGSLNDYEKAITAVGGIIGRYDSDQKFPVFGFGAKYSGVIQHCFQLGGKPEMDGISGVLQAYRSTFDTGLTMSGPTVFSEAISYTAATSRSKLESRQRIGQQCYQVLMILTDGAVTNVEQTKKAIYAASDAPLSIVIVGVGSADFSAMRELDDFLSGRQEHGRDIVRFVEFSHYANNRSSLTSTTLEEIPGQLVDFFFSRGIKPLPPISGSQMCLNAEEPSDEDIDLSVTIDSSGKVSLQNFAGAMFDETTYGTMATYNTPAPYVPSAASQHALNYQPSRYGGLSSEPSQYTSPTNSQQSSKFYVQVPPNVTAGMQLQVVNPRTKQNMIVVVPHGVKPGSKFIVQS